MGRVALGCGCFDKFFTRCWSGLKLARNSWNNIGWRLWWVTIVAVGLGWAGLVAVGGAVGMEIRSDHAGVYGWTGIIVGKPVNEAEPHGNVTDGGMR